MLQFHSTTSLNMLQVESSLRVQKLKPTIESIKAQYGDDKKAIQRETSALYESSGVNPTAGEHATAAMMPTAIQCYGLTAA